MSTKNKEDNNEYYVILDGQDKPTTTEGRVCVFTEKSNANTYLSLFLDGEHRIVTKNLSGLLDVIVFFDPPLS